MYVHRQQLEVIFVMTLIPIYSTYFRYQNFTANASQIIWILTQHDMDAGIL